MPTIFPEVPSQVQTCRDKACSYLQLLVPKPRASSAPAICLAECKRHRAARLVERFEVEATAAPSSFAEVECDMCAALRTSG